MTVNSKLVSILTPCYNGEKYVHKLLESVLSQNYPAIEFIVINDGSSDRSLAILEEYREEFKKRGIDYRIVSKKNGGAASAINTGLNYLNGEYVTFINVDEFLNDDSIGLRVSFLEKNREYDAVYSATDVVDDTDYYAISSVLTDTNPEPKKNLFIDMLLNDGYIQTPAYMMRADVLKKAHGAHQQMVESRAGYTVQLFLPVWHKAIVGYIDQPLVTITQHTDDHSKVIRDNRGELLEDREIENIYIDTLHKMDLSEQERIEYLRLVKQRFRRRNKRVFSDIQDGRDELARLYDRDEERFRASHFSDADTANQDQLASRMVFSAHSLEKSLSNDNFEIGHGFMVIRLLKDFLDVYDQRGYDKNHNSYISTLSVIKVFKERHKNTEYEEEINVILGDTVARVDMCQSDMGGAATVYAKDKVDNDKKNFKELAENRFAVRTYANKSVDKRDIEDVLAIAMKTPTVCNRQPVRVRVMYDSEIIARVLEVQGGIAYYDTPPVLLLVTADDNSYIGSNERNQGYVDGGLFAMSILYAFEYKNMAACPLHAMFETERDFKIRGMLDIPDNEKIITFISAGHFEEESGVCKSFRYPVIHILTEVDKIYDFEINIITPDPEMVAIVDEQSTVVDESRRKVRIGTRLRDLKIPKQVHTKLRESIAQVGRYLDGLEYNKAEGAILTLTGYFNYGNVIQRYAMQEFLRQNGHNFVSYVDPYSAPKDMYSIGRKRRIKTPLRAVKRALRSQKPYWYTPPYREIYPESYRVENIINFVNKNIWIKPYDPRDTYKKYIVGSDQVWRNWWGNKGILGYYFLDFIKNRDVKKIAYAASFGKDTIEEVMSKEDIEYVKPYIQDFQSISVREKAGVNIIKKIWDVAQVEEVIDPTLLLRAEDYSRLIDDSYVRNQEIKPIFTYILDETPELNNFIEIIQNARHQGVTKIRAHDGTENDILPPVELWLKGFRDAELVITNSFHGMMFSIINNTNFIIIGRKDGGLSRISDFLSEYDLEDRFVDEEKLNQFKFRNLKKINWESVNKRLNKRRQQSGSWLLKSIQN